MIELISTGFEDRVLGLRVRGPIDRADVDAVAAVLADKRTRRERLRIYAEVEQLGGMSLPALLEDLRLTWRHFRDIEREAIVTDAAWLGLLARTGNLLPGIEVRRFPWSAQAEARRWIQSDGGA
ncbi:MAG: STAS/SEC14 domain-containing protein [Chromatiaceae bacterium]|jgi:hypothetical protein|nr:STAS/SEC14 domain-containing protein [Chromatiaceae bacterium]